MRFDTIGIFYNLQFILTAGTIRSVFTFGMRQKEIYRFPFGIIFGSADIRKEHKPRCCFLDI